MKSEKGMMGRQARPFASCRGNRPLGGAGPHPFNGLLCFVVLLLLLLLAQATGEGSSPRERLAQLRALVASSTGADHVKQTLHFQLKKERGSALAAQAVARHLKHGVAERLFRAPALSRRAAHVRHGLDRWYRLDLKALSASNATERSHLVLDACEAALRHEAVAVAEPALHVQRADDFDGTDEPPVALPADQLDEFLEAMHERPFRDVPAALLEAYGAGDAVEAGTGGGAGGSFVPDDPFFAAMQSASLGAVNVPAAWAMTTGSPIAVVQVVDSGLDLAHVEHQVNVWRNVPEEDCEDGVDGDGNGFVDDCHGYNHADEDAGAAAGLLGSGYHGTFVAGILGATSDNGVGMSGVAGGKAGQPGAAVMVSTVSPRRPRACDNG